MLSRLSDRLSTLPKQQSEQYSIPLKYHQK
jgi:hypothetical protein